MTESQELVRREPADALSTVLGTGNTKAMLAQVEENVRAVIDVARDRGFVRRYGDNPNEFFGEPAWALLGMTYGLVAFVEWTKPVANGWEARAVARTRDGSEVAAAEAMCTRSEGARKSASDHTLRAMAQTRARRNALRSALGAALVLAGFDFADPESPATKAQIAVLHQLERELGLSHDEGHVRAGVESFKDLTREQAAELIDEWTAERDNGPAGRTEHPGSGVTHSRPGDPAPSDSTPAGGEGDGEAPEPPAAATGPDAWDIYQSALSEASFQMGQDQADKMIRAFWRERKLGPPSRKWDGGQLLELAQALEDAAAQTTLGGAK